MPEDKTDRRRAEPRLLEIEREAKPEPVSAPAPQISVREWAASQAAAVGAETALAFVSTFGRDTGTAAELEAALAAFRSRVVHQP